MANHKSNTAVAYKATENVEKKQLAVGESAGPIVPLRYQSGDLGLGNDGEPWIYVVDATGCKWLTHDVEWVLRNIHHFADRDQLQLLAGAALHYGLGAHALMGADLESMYDRWDVIDGAGRTWLKGIPYIEASKAIERFQRRVHWVAPAAIRVSRDDNHDDWRHKGPLVLLHHSLGISSITGVAVKSHVGRCGMKLEEALWRFDQFDSASKAELVQGLGKHFGFDPLSRPADQVGVAA